MEFDTPLRHTLTTSLVVGYDAHSYQPLTLLLAGQLLIRDRWRLDADVNAAAWQVREALLAAGNHKQW